MNEVSSNVRVLIVDDNYHFSVDILSYHLRRLGGYVPTNAFTVEQFKDQALEADIIILDIRLPEREHAPYNPWGGLRAMSEMQARGDLNDSQRKRLSRTIIRSGHSKDDAIRVGENIPEHHCWLSVDAPLSKLTRALAELTTKV